MEEYVIPYKKRNGTQILLPTYYDELIETNPVLKNNFMIPINSLDILEQRIKAFYSGESSHRIWLELPILSGDTLMLNPKNKKVKIVYNSKSALLINYNSNLDEIGGLELEEGTFDKTRGVEFTYEELEKYGMMFENNSGMEMNPFLLALARNNQKLASEYVRLSHSKLSPNREKPLEIDFQFEAVTSELEKPIFFNPISKNLPFLSNTINSVGFDDKRVIIYKSKNKRLMQ